MRIAFLSPVWKGSLGGGILSYTSDVVDRLTAEGHVVDVYALHGRQDESGGELQLAEPNGAAFVVKAFRLMLRRRYDAVLCNESRFTLPPAGAYAFLRRTRVVYVIHSFPTESELGALGRRFYSAPFALQSRDRFRVVFVSEQLKRHVIQEFGIREAAKASVIHAAAPPADRVRRDPDAVWAFRRTWGIQDDDWLVLGLGLTVLWDKAKGAALLILALSRMRLEGRPFKLMLTRQGYPIDWLRELVHICGLERDVIFTGEIPDPMLALNACDLYAHIVVDEGLPISLLEAMALGKPIVASRRAGIPEALEDGVEGVLVEPEVDALVSALRRMREDPNLQRRLGQAAQRRAAATSWEATTRKYVDLLEGR